MNEQPEALRLAAIPIFERSITWQSQATIELRRLHAELVESEKWRSRDEARAANAERERDIAEAQRDALLALVEKIRQWDMLDATADGTHWKREIDAAIKAVEEGK